MYGGREGHFCYAHSAKLIGTQPISGIRLARVLRISRSRFQYCALAKSNCTFREADSPVLHFPNRILILRTSQVRLFISRSGFTRSTFSKSDFNTAHFSSPIVHFAKRTHPFYIFQIRLHINCEVKIINLQLLNWILASPAVALLPSVAWVGDLFLTIMLILCSYPL